MRKREDAKLCAPGLRPGRVRFIGQFACVAELMRFPLHHRPPSRQKPITYKIACQESDAKPLFAIGARCERAARLRQRPALAFHRASHCASVF